MKKNSLKKPAKKKGANRPMEFARGWQELEDQHDRIKSDWMSLAAQLGISSRGRDAEPF